jgi:succinyl-CoA synthetase beta subunit
MDLFEYQGKELFAAAGIPVLPSRLAHTVDEAERAAAEVGYPLAVKAQVLTGGRGKAGGVRVVREPGGLVSTVTAILALTIRDKPVTTVLLEEAVDLQRELYAAVTLDRAAQRPLLIVSTRGGVNIEDVAREQPQALFRAHIDPLGGLTPEQIDAGVGFCALGEERLDVQLAGILHRLWQVYHDCDATLVEINPLALVAGRPGGHAPGAAGDGPPLLVALDAKVTVDDNAFYRQPLLAEWRPGEDEHERRAREIGVAYLTLDGSVGVLGNGAGLVMCTLDLIGAAGGKAADFCDVGGGARAERVAAALDIITSLPRVRALLINIVGGITRGDEVARGVLAWRQGTHVRLPLVVRLVGNNAAEGLQILEAAGLEGVRATGNEVEAVELAVAAAREADGGASGG